MPISQVLERRRLWSNEKKGEAMTTSEIAQALLLEGRRITKFDFLQEARSVCLPQRIEELRNDLHWAVQSKAIKGKKGLVEYWLEPSEIKRIKAEIGTYKQLVEPNKNNAETSQKAPLRSELTPTGVKIERVKEEQLGLGMPWE